MGVYSMDSIKKYINFYEIIKKKKKKKKNRKERVNIHLLYLIQTNITNQERCDGVLWIFIQNKNYFYFMILV